MDDLGRTMTSDLCMMMWELLEKFRKILVHGEIVHGKNFGHHQSFYALRILSYSFFFFFKKYKYHERGLNS